MFIATVLTITMFICKTMLLGFPCVIFWSIAGGYAYTQSTATWDIYYLLFFASMGMTIFCSLAMYALRTKKEEKAEGDELIDEGADKDVKFIDEGKEEEGIGRRTRAVRDRAARRRKYGIKKPLRLD